MQTFNSTLKELGVVESQRNAIRRGFVHDLLNAQGERTDDPQTMRGGRTSRRALKPAQGLERGRDGGEVKVMTITRAGPIVE